jgi:hypothetical protein
MISLLPEGVFDGLLFRPWPGRWLANGNWSAFCVSLSIGLSLGASALFMLDERLRRLGRPISPRLSRAVCVALTALSFLVYFDFFNPNTRYRDYYHRHEFYHYYLGSKYFDEIGYDRLYTCTAIAEVEAGHGEEIRQRDIRDLGAKNLIVPMTETFVFSDPERCKRHFSAARWQAFRADVAWFGSVSRGAYWDGMRTDHGYNPPPVWTMTGKLIASLAPAGDHFFKLLALLDVLLQLGALLLIGWAFGLRIMTIASVFWGCNAAADFVFTGGAFLRQDWYFLLVAALCLARRRHFAASGAALTWSTALRVFPIVTFAGVALIVLFDVLRKRRLRADYRRFIAGSAIAGGLLFATSCAVSGVGSYPAFVQHIRLHQGTPLTNNMGLEMLITHDWDARLRFTTDDRFDDPVQPWKEAYTAHARARRPLLLLLSAIELAWMAWALHRTKLLWVGMALSLPLSFSLLNVACYYQCQFIIGAALVALSPALGPAYLALAAASQVLATRFYWIDDRFTALSLLFFAFTLCSLYAVSRPMRRARPRAPGHETVARGRARERQPNLQRPADR